MSMAIISTSALKSMWISVTQVRSNWSVNPVDLAVREREGKSRTSMEAVQRVTVGPNVCTESALGLYRPVAVSRFEAYLGRLLERDAGGWLGSGERVDQDLQPALPAPTLLAGHCCCPHSRDSAQP